MTLQEFREKWRHFDWTATIPDDRFCDHVHPAFVEVIVDAGFDPSSDDEETQELAAEAVNELELSFFRSRFTNLVQMAEHSLEFLDDPGFVPAMMSNKGEELLSLLRIIAGKDDPYADEEGENDADGC